jgi:hypothetical protein
VGIRIVTLLLAAVLAALAATDQQVEQSIRWKLGRSPALSKERFTVRVTNGTAVIEGQTAVPQRKGAATRIAKAAGARKVENRITVTPGVPAAVKAAPGNALAPGIAPTPSKRKARVVRLH